MDFWIYTNEDEVLIWINCDLLKYDLENENLAAYKDHQQILEMHVDPTCHYMQQNGHTTIPITILEAY